MAERTNSIVINHLPVPTWNRLRVNSASVDLDRISAGQDAEFSETISEGIGKQTMPIAEAVSRADSYSTGIRREAYIAGKTAIYQKQIFATALGRDFTDLINDKAVDARIYTIPDGAKITEPVVLRWDFGKGADAAEQQIIYAGEDSEAHFVLVLESEADAVGLAMLMTKIVLGRGANVRLSKVNMLGNGFTVLDDTAVIEAEDAFFGFTQLILGGARVYTGCYSDQCGDSSRLQIDTGYLGKGSRLIDMNYVACQRGAKTDSKITVKGSLSDESVKVMRGTIDFRKGAKASTGNEQEDVLILSPQAVNKTVPVILVEEEDVDGRHGATIGNLPEDILFYLGTRGIGREEGKMLLTRGRLMSIARMIPSAEIIGKIGFFIREAFAQ